MKKYLGALFLLCSVGAPARAQVSGGAPPAATVTSIGAAASPINSDLTTLTLAATFSSSVTVQGAERVQGVLTAPNVGGATSFTSSVTVQSTLQVQNGIALTAATALTSGSGSLTISALPSVIYSSASVAGKTGTQATSAFLCSTGSTLTWASNGKLTNVKLSGTIRDSVVNTTCYVTFLLDGAVPLPLTTSIPAIAVDDVTGSFDGNAGFDITIRPSAGTHNVCLVIQAASGTCTLSAASVGQFSVQELP